MPTQPSARVNVLTDAVLIQQLYAGGDLWIENDGQQRRFATLAEAVNTIVPRLEQFDHFLWRPVSDVAGEARVYRDQIDRLHQAIAASSRRC